MIEVISVSTVDLSVCVWVCVLEDATVKLWDVVLGTVLYTLSSHQRAVTCVRWGGSDLIYSSSQDSTIKVWRAADVCPLEPIHILTNHVN